jgi:peroxiredoxin family protein
MTEEKKKRLAIIATKGSMDMAYPPLVLATTAMTMDVEAGIFFTLYGMDILRKDRYEKLKVAPLANPAMPMPVPNIMGVLPGMTAMATKMMKGWVKKINWPTVPEMLEMCREGGVKLIACSPTMDMLGLTKDDLIDGVEIAGAAEYLEFALEADITLSF